MFLEQQRTATPCHLFDTHPASRGLTSCRKCGFRVTFAIVTSCHHRMGELTVLSSHSASIVRDILSHMIGNPALPQGETSCLSIHCLSVHHLDTGLLPLLSPRQAGSMKLLNARFYWECFMRRQCIDDFKRLK